MAKQKKWQFTLILIVMVLTFYHVLPTLFYYLKPLKSPVSASQAIDISRSMEKRISDLEKGSEEWLLSFCRLCQTKPQSIVKEGSNWTLHFTTAEEAARIRSHLPRAGSLIPFAPAQLRLPPQNAEDVKEVVVSSYLDEPLSQDLFSYAAKGSPAYRSLILDRAAQIAYTLAGPSDAAFLLNSADPSSLEVLALQIQSIREAEEINKTFAHRAATSFTQGPFLSKPKTIQALIAAFQDARDQLKKQPDQQNKEMLFQRAEKYLKQHEATFASGETPWNLEQIKELLSHSDTLYIGSKNPLFSELSIDWAQGQILLTLHPDVQPAKLKQPLMNEAARVTHRTGESVTVSDRAYTIGFHQLSDVTGLLILNVEQLASRQAERILATLQKEWHPQHPDLKDLELADADSWETLRPEQKALSLVVHKPNAHSLSIASHGIQHILNSYRALTSSDLTQTLRSDVDSLVTLLQQEGFEPHYQGELYFVKARPFAALLAATREDFQMKGSQVFLELSNVEQRLLTSNRIDTQIHEDLMKWQDEYSAAQVSLQPGAKYDVPKPTRSVLWSNFLLSWKKYFRGDLKNVLQWGLDLSGGKTVQIELRDAANRLVHSDEEIKQGINELYTRVNKMGVSEVAIRQLGSNIVLDFPGAQSLAASELIKASSMYFHVVNETFSSLASPLAPVAQKFLQEVWNEALITHAQDPASIEEIAWSKLQGNLSETARILVENGLVLQAPDDFNMGQALNDSVSKIVMLRGEPTEWLGQSHPLLFVFRNYALEGAGLGEIQASYDPQKGNYLHFGVDRASRDPLHSWTSRYAKDSVIGTSLEEVTKGRGWRMAVILNDTVISAPSLEATIRDGGSITGHFSQREITRLATDLKAGSLSFTPHILSEKNVSPELGLQDRVQGIVATVIALLLVVVSMIAYYRFAGLVASIAVLFNLLILWATLQNIHATLSLAGIAGIILTVGMAVDANVLVFERIKEEFTHSKKIGAAIAAGYKKAYSAIIDSNVTTIIAALILLNFDAGPIKGFAITLIIGIVSSMFTALFMTRFYFDRWVENPKHKMLKMADWIRSSSIDFLKRAKLAFFVATFITIVGGFLIYTQRAHIFGMDFTGGFSLELEVSPQHTMASVEHALIQAGAKAQDIQVRTLDAPHHLRLLLSTGLQESGNPFFGMPMTDAQGFNPRIQWVVHALEAQNIALTPHAKELLTSSWTAMSGQMSDSMRNNALLGLLIAFVCIFIYITVRFEYKFAAASILCLLHDVFITLGMIGILHALGAAVQIDLNTVAAIMTIVGYSLNDTIIIFDRIREEMHLKPHGSLPQLVNHALNATLSRTTITSGTTLLVLVALVLLGGSSIFSFALVMTIGVFFGTLSSWYIASPLMLFFHGKETKYFEKAPL